MRTEDLPLDTATRLPSWQEAGGLKESEWERVSRENGTEESKALSIDNC